MRFTTGLLPPSFAQPRISPRAWLALAAGIGCAVCAYAGLYPRFDDGALRVVIALTSAPFAAAVVASSLSARSAARAFGMTVLLAALLGAASTIIPAAMLAHRDSGEFVFACVLGAFFGSATGAIYGVPLGILTAAGWDDVRANTHASTDRAARIGGAWLAMASLFGLLGTCVLDHPVTEWVSEGTTRTTTPSAFPSAVAIVGVLGALALVIRATLRLKRRHAWIERVRSGLEPAFRTRVVDVRDRVGALPRLGDGETVVEYIADETSGAAYRVAATGTAVALVSDPR
jgi:hypothetical protein